MDAGTGGARTDAMGSPLTRGIAGAVTALRATMPQPSHLALLASPSTAPFHSCSHSDRCSGNAPPDDGRHGGGRRRSRRRHRHRLHHRRHGDRPKLRDGAPTMVKAGAHGLVCTDPIVCWRRASCSAAPQGRVRGVTWRRHGRTACSTGGCCLSCSTSRFSARADGSGSDARRSARWHSGRRIIWFAPGRNHVGSYHRIHDNNGADCAAWGGEARRSVPPSTLRPAGASTHSPRSVSTGRVGTEPIVCGGVVRGAASGGCGPG